LFLILAAAREIRAATKDVRAAWRGEVDQAARLAFLIARGLSQWRAVTLARARS
jgi:hypothetical protein